MIYEKKEKKTAGMTSHIPGMEDSPFSFFTETQEVTVIIQSHI